tara:strand:- start:872 stop:997 length:126 start_codon:yes stop_codon:yes gene_type:complete
MYLFIDEGLFKEKEIFAFEEMILSKKILIFLSIQKGRIDNN